MLARVSQFFFQPASTERKTIQQAAQPITAVVFGRNSDALPVAGAVANELRHLNKAETAIVISTSPNERAGKRFRSSLGARRWAVKLQNRDLDACAVGNIVWVTLPAEVDSAIQIVEQLNNWVNVPTVVGVFTPLNDAWNNCLQDMDVAVFVVNESAPTGLVSLLTSSFESHRETSLIARPITGQFRRKRAQSGHARFSALRVMASNDWGQAGRSELVTSA